MIDINEKTLAAVSKYIVAFIILMLAGACVFLYMDNQKIRNQKDMIIEQLNAKMREKDEKALEEEKERTSRYEFLLSNLRKNTHESKEVR